MSPTNFHDHHHQAKSSSNINNNNMYPPPLKVNKDSHMITKKSSSPSSSPPSSSSSSSVSSLGVAGPAAKPPQRRPVIIYTHSPKIIHTHPKDFMALVQKLTGLSRSEDEPTPQVKQENGNRVSMGKENNNYRNVKIGGGGGGGIANDDNESSNSVITDHENCGSISGDGQVNSCFMPPIFQPPNQHYMTNVPVFTAAHDQFLGANQPFNYNYTTDPLFFPSPNLRNSISSTSALEVKNEFCGY